MSSDKKLTYEQFYDLNRTLERVYPRINMDEINKVIDGITCISDARKDYLKKSILYRKENILYYVYRK